MSSEFLSICIPTRNRAHLLKDLLQSVAEEIRRHQLTPADLRIYVSDNASEDATPTVARDLAAQFPHFVVSRNASNLGAVGNVLLCARKGEGTYQWILGDDEQVAPDGLKHILDHLRTHRPSWFINRDLSHYGSRLGLPRAFPDARSFLDAAAREDPETVMTAGTLSFNVFRRDCFDHEVAEAHRDTIYPHYYGLLHGLKRVSGPVFFTGFRTIIIREQRPPPVDGEFPEASDANWRRCLNWAREQFDLESLDPDAYSRLVSQSMIDQFRRHPWKTLRNNASLLLLPGAYPRIARRLWMMIRRR